MIKKSIYILLFVVSIISLLVGCDTKTEENMSVTVTDITIQIGEVYKIEVSNASGPVVFESSDSNIVTVNEEGQITGVSVGFANVTVSDSDESITCSITVLEIPYDGVHLISIDADVVDLIIGDEYELEPKLLRGTDVVEGAQFKYSSSDESVATVTNGVIKALKAGETTIQIDSVDYEKTSKNITVNVSNDFVIDLSESDLVLSKNNFLDYVNSKEVNFIVKEQGQKLDVENLSVSISDDNVVSVEKNDGNYLIKALNFGDAIITFSYTKEDGSETTSYINVSVVKPVVELEDVYYFSKINGSLDFNEIDLENINLTIDGRDCIEVYDSLGNEYSIINKNEDKVFINCNNIAENGEIKHMYYDMSEYIISVDIVQCTLAIRTVEDFLSMRNLLEAKRCDDGLVYKRIDGYIALVNDLDFTGIEYEPFCGYYQVDTLFAGRSGFNAIFEGNNKIIKNIKLGKDNTETKWNSIFGNVGWDGQIRNLAIVDCEFGAKATGAVLADYFHGIAKNVFISATINTGHGSEIENTTSGFSVATPYKYSTIEEVTIIIKNTLPEENNKVISAGQVSGTFEGTYNLSNSPIKSLICIGGGDYSKLLIGYKSLNEIKAANGAKGFVISYDTASNAANNGIANNGSTSFGIEDYKLQIYFNGTLVYSE